MPIDLQPIGIIGGKGQMGTLFAKAFRKRGLKVLISDQNTRLTNIQLAKQCRVIIISVPIRLTSKVIQEIGPYLTESQLITDFTSVKMNPTQQMTQYTKAEVIGGHPLFGVVQSFINQNFILCPVRGDAYVHKYLSLLKSLGLQIVTMSATEHDQFMGIIQCLTHLSNLSLANTIKNLKFDFKAGERISSPIYRLRMYIIGRILAQDPGLYTDIEFENPFSSQMAKEYLSSVEKLQALISSKNKTAFETLFKEIAAYFGPHAQRSHRITSQLIKHMSKLH